MEVHLLWHVRHARNLDGSPIQHRDEDGDLAFDEQFDDCKMLGVYADPASAEAAIARARSLPGFRDEPDCFMIDTYTVGKDQWTEGFVTNPTA